MAKHGRNESRLDHGCGGNQSRKRQRQGKDSQESAAQRLGERFSGIRKRQPGAGGGESKVIERMD
jgi:hypothetical protein